MSQKRGAGKKDGGTLPPEDVRLWQAVTRDVAPLHVSEDIPVVSSPALPEKNQKKRLSSPVAPPPILPHLPQEPPQLDARTDRRLRRGQMEIEATLDLHGMGQVQAYESLKNFVLSSAAKGLRCVLVITGKGRMLLGDAGPGGGVLRQKLPVWLGDAALSSHVLKAVSAAPKHGGQGAFYVYLKRNRER